MAVILSVALSGYVPLIQRPDVCPARRSPFISMVTAQEVFGQYFEASPPVQKSLQKMPSGAAKGAMAGIVGAAGVAGFALTPSRRIYVNTVGGVLSATVGNLARKRVAEERQKAAVPAVAARLSEGLQKVSTEELSALAAEYDVPKKQFETQCAELYLAFLNACLASGSVDPKELSELLRLQAVLSLSAARVGTQVYAAARQLYSRHRAYLEDTEENDSKKLLAKFVFLAERILSYDESPEGYRYDSLRLQKLFGLTTMDWRQMAEEAAVPFYGKALDSAVVQAKPVTAAQLASVRDSLGITEGCAEGMHADIYGQAAKGMLEASQALSAADKDRLAQAETLLGMAPEAASATLQALTAPLYTASFEGVLAEAEAGGASAPLAGKLAARQAELLLASSDALGLEKAALRAKAKGALTAALKSLREQNVPQGLEEIKALVGSVETLAAFMVEIEHAEGPSEAALASLLGGVKAGTKQSEVLALYRVLLLHYLEDLKVDEVEAAGLARLRTVLGLSDAESDSVYQAAAGPLLRQAVSKAVSSDLGEAAKAELDASLADLALPASVTSAVNVESYTTKLKALASESAILSEESSAELTKLREFLGISMEEIYPAHEDVCSDAYGDSVRQVMGTSGVIPDEYWDGLNRLRERLCLSEEAAQAMFAVEVTGKMKTFAQTAMEVMQKKMEQQQKQQQGEGEGGELGVESLSASVLNLVDFAVAAKVIVSKEGAGKEFEVCGANLKGQFEDRALKELYKQYLIEAFSGGDAAQNERLFNNLNRLALVLGLAENDVANIHNEIGGYIYRNYISKALQKGPLGAEEMQFLSSIKDALSMEQAKCDELVKECQEGRISMLIEQMFEKSAVVADDVRKMRDEAEGFDCDLDRDLQLGKFKLDRLFLCEMEDLVESGDLKEDDMSPLVEVAEFFHVSEEQASTMLEASVQKRTSAGVLQAATSKRQGNTDTASAEIERMLKFAALLPETKAETKFVSMEERNELYMLYQAKLLSAGEMTPEGLADLELLKAVMGTEAKAPA